MTPFLKSNRASLVLAAEKINATLERRFWMWVSLFVLIVLAGSIAKDLRSKMWIDELFTLHMSRQPSFGAIIHATIQGSDASPPLYPMVVHSILPIINNDALAVRLPSTIGFIGMIFLLLGFCRRRLPAAYSMVAALFACNACLYYSVEGRSYGIVLCCAASALVCWQAATEGRKRSLMLVLLALSLALMTAFHYYAIFFLVPLFLAELVRWRTTGKVDWQISLAIASPLLVLALHYPLIVAAQQFQEHYYSPAAWRQIPKFYINHLLPMLLFCPVALLALAVFPASAERNPRESSMPMHEWVALATLALMPAIVVIVTKYTTHSYVYRYTLWSVIGFALMLSALMALAARLQPGVGVAMMGVLAALIVVHEVLPLFKTPLLREGQEVLRQLAALPDSDVPIVIANYHVFMELSYYAEPRLRQRLVYPVSRSLELRYTNSDTGSILMASLSHTTRLRVVNSDAFLLANKRMVLAASPSDYFQKHLIASGFRVVPDPGSATSMLYEVEALASN